MSIRKDFPILRTSENGKTITYLDSAATTQKPTSVIAAVDHYYRQQNSNIHRAAHHLADIATRAYEHARELCRDYIGAAETAEIIFTSGTTASINLVAQALTTSVKPGQTIVISELEHHSNIVPWQMLAERTGAQIEAIAITDEGDLDLADARVKIDSRCALVAITHISNGLGSINPVDEIIQLAKQQDALTLVDGAQAALHLDLDVQALDCDFYVFSGHKLFAPTGIGILYGKRRRLEELPPASGGGEMIEKVTLTKSTYQKPPFKFEPGTPNIAGAIG
ncbi:MAG TPA: cysteine desulfurase CsdA, partial [Gammaproteobacteria bacterium]|nr:cysteine desulfurase CsdA [Gammaproteobacteria bacterium]